VFDRIDAGAQRVLDSFGADRVRATRRPWRWASEIADSSSSGSSWAFPGTAPWSARRGRDHFDAVAPSNICSRTALRASYGLSTIRPANQPCRPSCRSRCPRLACAGPECARGDRVANVHRDAARATDVAHGRHAGLQRLARVLHRVEHALVRRERAHGVHRVGLAVISKCTCALTSPGVTHSAARSNWPPSAALRISRIVAPSTTTSTFRRGSSSDPS